GTVGRPVRFVAFPVRQRLADTALRGGDVDLFRLVFHHRVGDLRAVGRPGRVALGAGAADLQREGRGAIGVDDPDAVVARVAAARVGDAAPVRRPGKVVDRLVPRGVAGD